MPLSSIAIDLRRSGAISRLTALKSDLGTYVAEFSRYRAEAEAYEVRLCEQLEALQSSHQEEIRKLEQQARPPPEVRPSILGGPCRASAELSLSSCADR